jgi:CubicO group peptidase (beta-lactamase class C family)
MDDSKPAKPPHPIRRAGLTFTVALSVLLGASVRADDYVLDRFSDFLEQLRIQAGSPALAAAMVGSDDILWERAFGRQDLSQSLTSRTDTPFHLNGVTQIFTAAMVLRCVEDGQLFLDDRVSRFRPNSPDANATLGQLLTHTSATSGGLVFGYRPDRLDPLSDAVRACNTGSFRKTLSNVFEQFGMMDSVPGPDAADLVPPAQGIPTAEAAQRYRQILGRLATPYVVDTQGRPSLSRYGATTLTPGNGAISTVRNIARFDLALKKGVIVRRSTLADALVAPVGANGQRLPHAYGWFVQSYNGMPIAWQFGVDDGGSSSLIITLPARGLTLILLANSSGLVRPLALASGDLNVSPFGKLFLNAFAR